MVQQLSRYEIHAYDTNPQPLSYPYNDTAIEWLKKALMHVCFNIHGGVLFDIPDILVI